MVETSVYLAVKSCEFHALHMVVHEYGAVLSSEIVMNA